MRGSGRGRAPGARVRVSAFNWPALLPTEGSSLRGLGRGRSVRLQDPSGEPCVLWKGRAGAKGEDAGEAPGGVGCRVCWESGLEVRSTVENRPSSQPSH